MVNSVPICSCPPDMKDYQWGLGETFSKFYESLQAPTDKDTLSLFDDPAFKNCLKLCEEKEKSAQKAPTIPSTPIAPTNSSTPTQEPEPAPTQKHLKVTLQPRTSALKNTPISNFTSTPSPVQKQRRAFTLPLYPQCYAPLTCANPNYFSPLQKIAQNTLGNPASPPPNNLEAQHLK